MSDRRSEPTSDSSTLVELLRWRALHQPQRRAYTFLVDGETEEVHLTYGELDLRARAVAALLQSCGASGQRALLLYQPGLDFIIAFFGCLYAGVVAAPAYPPRPNRPTPRLQAIATDAQAKIGLTTDAVLSQVKRQFAQAPELAALQWLVTDHDLDELAGEWEEPVISSHMLAFLQYTSGSTSTPKGVMVSHGNLSHNERMGKLISGHTEQSTFVGWLPLYHDMGLIGMVLQTLYVGAPCVFMSPMAFLQKPARWLQAVSRYKAHTSGGPNFAYDLCVQRVTPEQRATLDLSNWRVAFNGAEPIRAATLEQFAATFEPCGFRPRAFLPCYGLAEATLMVSGGPSTALPVVRSFRGAALEKKELHEVSGEEEDAHRLVGCGQTMPGQKIVIVVPQTNTQCPPDQVGEIWVAGPSVAQGYWERPAETERTFHAHLADTGEGPFLRTGDLGFLRDGELFVTGRLKDLIIIDGRNHYPQDIELSVEQSHPSIRAGCCAAFSIDVSGKEQLVVVAEVWHRARPGHALSLDVKGLVKTIRRAVTGNHDIQVYAARLLAAGSIPKTSSGKIQRHACRAGFLDGTLDCLEE